MTAEIKTFPTGENLPAAPKPLDWIEPAIAPNIVTSIAPRVDVYGPLSVLYWAFVERSLDTSEREMQAIVVAKLTMPTGLLREAGAAMIAAADGDGVRHDQ
jgi:hypothetical protein